MNILYKPNSITVHLNTTVYLENGLPLQPYRLLTASNQSFVAAYSKLLNGGVDLLKELFFSKPKLKQASHSCPVIGYDHFPCDAPATKYIVESVGHFCA